MLKIMTNVYHAFARIKFEIAAELILFTPVKEQKVVFFYLVLSSNVAFIPLNYLNETLIVHI